jgi:hypothetical protein
MECRYILDMISTKILYETLNRLMPKEKTPWRYNKRKPGKEIPLEYTTSHIPYPALWLYP